MYGSGAARLVTSFLMIIRKRKLWDWNAQRLQIEASVYGAFNLKIKESPRIVDALPTPLLKKWREIEELGGTPVLKKRRYWGVGIPGRQTRCRR